LSRHEKKGTARRALTLWGLWREGLVRAQEESHQARDTSQGPQGEWQVRRQKESGGVRGTHPLGAMEGRTCQE